MKALSHFSLNPDPYKAGIEIAEKVSTIEPEIIFVFPTIHYGGSPEMAEAIYDVVGKDDLILAGNTGDGFYEKNKVSNSGVSALAINSENKIKWLISSEKGMSSDPYGATKRCMDNLNKKCDFSLPVLYFLASDFKTDAKEIMRALSDSAKGPLIGGLAGDDNSFTNSFVYAGREVFTDSIVIVAMNGIFEYEIKTAHELQPTGSIGQVTETEGTTIIKIAGIPAMDFVEREIGKPINLVDQGIITFKVTEKEKSHGHQIRSVLLPENISTDTSVKLFSAVDAGNFVQVCLAPPEMMLKDIKEIGNSLKNLSFEPLAAIIVSCAGRKKALSDDVETEVINVTSNCPSIHGLAGYPSFGEFGSVKNITGYTKPLFHNMTFILLLLGETK